MNGDKETRAPAIASPAEDGVSWWPAAFGLVAGALAAIGWMAASSDSTPAGAVAAGAFGLLAALAVWLLVDTIDDHLRRSRSLTADKSEIEYGQATVWGERLRRHLRTRYAAAALAAMCGAVATYVRLTPERVLHQDHLTLGFPALVGLGVAAIGSWATLARTSAWESLFADWPRQKVDPPQGQSLPPATSPVNANGSPASPSQGEKPEPQPEPSSGPSGMTANPPPPSPPPPEKPKPLWTPPTPSDGDNDERC